VRSGLDREHGRMVVVERSRLRRARKCEVLAVHQRGKRRKQEVRRGQRTSFTLSLRREATGHPLRKPTGELEASLEAFTSSVELRKGRHDGDRLRESDL
jgi:hypothetical protein